MVRAWKRTLSAMDKLRNLSTAELRERCEDVGIELLPASATFTKHELATILVQDAQEKLPPRHRPSVTPCAPTVSVSRKRKFEDEEAEAQQQQNLVMQLDEEHKTDSTQQGDEQAGH